VVQPAHAGVLEMARTQRHHHPLCAQINCTHPDACPQGNLLHTGGISIVAQSKEGDSELVLNRQLWGLELL